MSLKQRLYPGLLFLFVANLIVITTALSLPETSWQFSISKQNTLQAQKPGQQPKTVTMFYHNDKQITAHYHLAIDEPDKVESYQEFNNILLANSLLSRALEHNELGMKLSDGSFVKLTDQGRQLKDLPPLFWLQIFCGSMAVLILILVKVVHPKNPGSNALTILGLSFMLFTFAAAIYSTRNLIINGHLFHALSMLNHTGAMLFSAGTIALLWKYPKVITDSHIISGAAFAIVAINIMVDGLQLTKSPATGSYTWTLALLIFGLSGAVVQWWFARNNPLNRACVRWLLLAIFSGTAFFLAAMVIPVMLKQPAPAPQGVLFFGFLLMYACFALGVSQYELSRLERYWFYIWAYTIAVLTIYGISLALQSSMGFAQNISLAIATAIVGWLFFPATRSLRKNIKLKRGQYLQHHLPSIINNLLSVRSAKQLESMWQKTLQKVFQATTYEEKALCSDTASTHNNGLQLAVPKIGQCGSIMVSQPGHGKRLFTQIDIDNAMLLLSIFQTAMAALLIKTETASQERDLIRQNINDALSTKLLAISQLSQEPELTKLADQALNHLKHLLAIIETQPVDIYHAMELWKQETKLLHPPEVALTWLSPEQQLVRELSPLLLAHLTLAIRGCLSLAFANPTISKMTFEVNINQNLEIIITTDSLDQGNINNQNLDTIETINKHCQSLSGAFQSEQLNGYWQAHISIPFADSV